MMTVLRAGLEDALRMENLRYFLYAMGIVLGGMGLLYLLLQDPVGALLLELDRGEGWLYWGAGIALHMLLGVLGYFLIPPLILLVAALFSEQIVRNITLRHAPQQVAGLDQEGISVTASLLMVGKSFLFYLLLMVLLSPLLLTGIGYLLYFVLGYLLFRRLLLIEVLGGRSGMASLRQQLSIRTEGYRLTMLLLYLLTMVPLANLFVPYLALCVVTHESLFREGITPENVR